MRRKAIILVLISVMICTFSVAQAQQFADVDPGHWAYEAIKQLVDAGIIPVFEDGTFRGNEPVDRYTLASVIAAALEKVTKDSTGLTEEDLTLLQRLSTEFRADLVQWYEDRELLVERINNVEKLMVAVDDSISQSLLGIQALDVRTVQLKERIDQELVTKEELEAELSVLSTTVATLLVEFGQESQLLDQVQQEVAALQDKAVAMGITTSDLQAGLEKLQVQQTDFAGRVQQTFDTLQGLITTLQQQSSALAGRLDLSEQELASLQQQVNVLSADLKSLQTLSQEMSSQVNALASRVNVLEERSLALDLSLSELSDRVQKEVEDRQAQILKLSDSLQALEGLLDATAEETAAALGKLQRDLFALEDVVITLQPDLAHQLSGTKDELNRLYEAQSKLVAENRSMIDKLQRDLATQEATLSEYAKSMQNLAELLVGQGALLDQQKAALDKLAQDLGSQLAAHNEAITQLQAVTVAQQQALTQLQEEINRWIAEQQQLADRQAKAEASLQEQLVKLEGKIQALQQEDAKMQQAIVANQDSLAQQGTKLQELDGKLQALQGELGTRLDTLQRDLEARLGSLEGEVNAQVTTLEGNMDERVSSFEKKVQADLGTLERDLEDRLKALQGELDGRVTILEGELEDNVSLLKAELDEKLNILKAQLDELTLELGLLSGDLEDGHSSLAAQLAQLAQQCDTLSQELAALLAAHNKLDSTVASNLQTMEQRRIQELAATETKLQLELKGLGARVEEVAAEINYLNQNLAEEVAAHISGYRISESQLVGKVEDLTQQFTSYRQASQAKIEELEGKVSTMQLVAVLGLIIALIK